MGLGIICMQYFFDQERGILWYEGDYSIGTQEMSQELNSWDSDGINDYIISRDQMKLGDFTNALQDFKTYRRFFGYIDGELSAVVVMNGGDRLKSKNLLLEHIINSDFGTLKPTKQILSANKAQGIVFNDNNRNNDYILYLIVAPQRQGRGYGTRVVSSIKNNIEFFAKNSLHNSLSTQIHDKNIPSQKVFERNNFHTLNLSFQPCKGLSEYFLEDDLIR